MRLQFYEMRHKKTLWDAKTTLPKKENWLNTYPLVIRTLHTQHDTCKELLEIASEVVVHRITQVGRIRAGYYTVILIV